MDQSLPPILHIFIPIAVSSCSKGPRGLSVLPRVGGIFTSTTISLDPSSRQLPSRYAIHAGVTPYTSSYELAECCVFGKQSGGTLCCNLQCLRSKSFTKLGTPYTEDTVLFCRVPWREFFHAP